MPDKPFVINDRRKFTAEGERRDDAPEPEQPKTVANTPEAKPSTGPQLVTEPAAHEPAGPADPQASFDESASASAERFTDDELQTGEPPAPTHEQTEQVNRAYAATLDRLDIALRAQNLGADHPPPVTFSAVIQTLFMQALMMLGGAAEPGQPVSVDPMGARQIIDMIGVVVDKAQGNLTSEEEKFCTSALFELRMGFLEITQRLARQAAAKSAGMPGTPGGPNLVR